MSDVLKNQYLPDSVSAPGETLLEMLNTRGMSQAELADRTGRPTKTINEIVKGKAAITPETALQFELVLGVPATFWNNREQHYREALARKREAKSLATQVSWLDRIPYKAMVKMGWIPETDNKIQLFQHVLMFFGVASPTSWSDVWRTANASFRQSPTLKSDAGAVAAWLRKGEIEAIQVPADEFNPSRFREVLGRIRRLTRDLPNNFASLVVAECGKAGVKVVFVPELPRTCTWGATRWLSQSNALIQLSLRYKTDDHLWFTFFHEAAHILLHGKRTVIVETEDRTKDEKELEADSFAQEWLIPENEYKKFKRLDSRSCAAISRFAHELGIAPGIVVGRLQHDGVLARTNCNHLKKQVGWADSEK
jgi:HTH-type transcriptional regulator / antitoxin HigA